MQRPVSETLVPSAPTRMSSFARRRYGSPMRTRASQWLVATPSTSCFCTYVPHYELGRVPSDASGRACFAVLAPPSIPGPMPNTPGTPLDRGHKTLPLRPRPRYNPHSLQATGSGQPVLPGGPVRPVAGLCSAGPAG